MECALDLLGLCEDRLGKKVDTIEDFVVAWNSIRADRGLEGKWELEEGEATGIFHQCGCPLVRSAMIRLHPVQCYCSRAMVESIFSEIAGKHVHAEIKRSIGRGDEVCEFNVTY